LRGRPVCRFERPVICGALMERSEGDFLASAQLAKEMGADCLEVRADGLGDPDITSVENFSRP